MHLRSNSQIILGKTLKRTVKYPGPVTETDIGCEGGVVSYVSSSAGATFQVGDKLVEINGKPCDGLTQEKIFQIWNTGPKSATVQVTRGMTLSVFTNVKRNTRTSVSGPDVNVILDTDASSLFV